MVSDPLCSAVVRNPFASVLWRNSAFRRVWAASTVSVFGSLVTRIALPLVAILVLGVGSVEMSILRSLDLVAALVFGLVAGAWVDRLRRRPVLIWADLGRAVLLGSIPAAFVLGVLTFPHLLVVTGLAAVLTVFFDSADNAYLPTVVERERLTDAERGAVGERLGLGVPRLRARRRARPGAERARDDRHRRRHVPRLGGPARLDPDARSRRRRRQRTASR